MRKIERTNVFKRDYKREKAGQHKNFEDLISETINLLAEDIPLPERCRDHSLSGDMMEFRECLMGSWHGG